jgi:WhiB family redox-sensing transcriptional regulator
VTCGVYTSFALTARNDTRVIPYVSFPREVVMTELTGSLPDTQLAEIFGLPEEASWQERALCSQTDPEAFFPEKGGSTREAKRICTGCEVRSECLEYALEHDERFGIWGGLSERERRRLRRRAV